MKRKYKLKENDDTDEEEEDTNIKVFGNTVYFYTEVSKKNILVLKEKLDEAAKNANESQFRKKIIFLHINSGGGCVYAGLSGLNLIKNYPCKIKTIADGFVASAATLLFLAGSRRYITKFSHVLIHQLSTCFYGKFDELKDEVKNSSGLMEYFKTIYSETTNLSSKKIDEYLGKELCLTSSECLKYGIAHKVK